MQLIFVLTVISLACCSLGLKLNSPGSWGRRSTALLAKKKNSKASMDASVSQVGVVLLAGGKGTRMKAAMPKQFLPVLGREVFLRSLDVFLSMGDVVSDIAIVLDESFRDDYAFLLEENPKIRWANPGIERQDSVFNGLNSIPDSCSIVAIHDAARPLVTVDEVTRCLKDGLEHGAAVLGVPMKATVKESKNGKFVRRTVPRKTLWEIHTPQVSTKELFLRGFEKTKKDNLEVTDDASVIEALGEPVKITMGEYTNIKITTPEDIAIAEQILRKRGVQDLSPSAQSTSISASTSASTSNNASDRNRSTFTKVNVRLGGRGDTDGARGDTDGACASEDEGEGEGLEKQGQQQGQQQGQKGVVAENLFKNTSTENISEAEMEEVIIIDIDTDTETDTDTVKDIEIEIEKPKKSYYF